MVELEFLLKLHDAARGPGAAVTLRFEERWPCPPRLDDRFAYDVVVAALGYSAPVERVEWRRGGFAVVELGNHRVEDLERALRLLHAWTPVSTS